MAKRVVLGIPETHRQWPRFTGHGRLWRELLARLPAVVDLQVVADVESARPDVWLINGHPEWHERGLREIGRVLFSPERSPAIVHLHEGALGVSEKHPATARLFERKFADATSEVVASADVLVTPSAFSRNQILQGYPDASPDVRVVPHGVDTSVFRPGRPPPRFHLSRAGLPEGQPFVLCVSAIHPRKNLRALREAISTLQRRGYPHELVLVSSWTYGVPDQYGTESEVFGDDDALCRVRLLSELSDDAVAGLMGTADAFCFPSLMEGFGLAPLEAMACGTPCVVSNAGSLPEVVGDAAVLVDPDPFTLADGLESVLSDPALCERMRAAGRHRARLLSWESSVREWGNVITHAVTRETRRVGRVT